MHIYLQQCSFTPLPPFVTAKLTKYSNSQCEHMKMSLLTVAMVVATRVTQNKQPQNRCEDPRVHQLRLYA